MRVVNHICAFLGRKYGRCTTAGNSGVFWCSTKTDENGVHVTNYWGNCNCKYLGKNIFSLGNSPLTFRTRQFNMMKNNIKAYVISPRMGANLVRDRYMKSNHVIWHVKLNSLFKKETINALLSLLSKHQLRRNIWAKLSGPQLPKVQDTNACSIKTEFPTKRTVLPNSGTI